MNNKTYLIDNIIEVLVLYRLAVTIMPIVGVYTNSLINIFTFLLLFISIFIKSGIERTLREIIYLLPIFSIMILDILCLYIKGDAIVGQIYELFISLQWPFIGIYLIRQHNVKRIKRILLYALLCYIITSLTTYFGNVLFPGVARHMSNGRFAEENPDLITLYYSYNIGTFTFIYSLVILFPLLIFIYRKYSKGVKFISLVSIISIIMVIVKTEYTTALLMMFSSFLLFMLPKKFNERPLWRMLILTLVVIIMLIPFLTSILEFLSNIIGSEQVSERLLAISQLLESKSLDDSNDLGQRFVLWRKSWHIFASNFFTGSSIINGGHSFILDNMARYGLIGLISLIILYIKMYKLSIKPYKKSIVFGYVLYAFIINIILCLLNPINNYFILTFILPLFSFYCFDDEMKTLNENVLSINTSKKTH